MTRSYILGLPSVLLKSCLGGILGMRVWRQDRQTLPFQSSDDGKKHFSPTPSVRNAVLYKRVWANGHAQTKVMRKSICRKPSRSAAGVRNRWVSLPCPYFQMEDLLAVRVVGAGYPLTDSPV